MNPKSVVSFAIICGVALTGLAAYLYRVAERTQADARSPVDVASVATRETQPPPTAGNSAAPPADLPPPTDANAPRAPAVTPLDMAKPADAPERPAESARLYFRHNGVQGHYGSIAWIDTAKPRDIHFVDGLRCEVVHVSGGHGICLSAKRGVFTTYAATLFDANTFEKAQTFTLKGIPSRTRMSRDGTLAALTVFVSGHGYTTLDFSTQTLLIDVASGRPLADLEDFAVSKDGAPIKNPDFNFWGVTFTPDAKTFYATLSTNGNHYLIRGDIAARTAQVIHENVECPSLSPDARRIAYKKRLTDDNRIVWQLHVLDLDSGRETALSEKRSIDDQLEWLDNRHVLYSVPSAADGSSPSTDVWQVAIDARTPPKLFLPNAYSPATARNPAR